MIWHRLTVLLGAFLLMQVQPLIARYLLLWFGGTYSVWTASMLFFQVALLLGYGLAHLGAVRAAVRWQARGFLAGVGVALAVLAWQVMDWGGPMLPPLGWQPRNADAPTPQVLSLLAVAVGAPFVLLAMVSTTIQAWSARLWQKRSPYPLYAYSNLGSLLGLLTYPFFVEPLLGLRAQAAVWTGGFLLFASVASMAAVRVARAAPAPMSYEERDAKSAAPMLWLRLLWVWLAATGAILLLATTNQLTQEIGSISLLWVAPLAVYLASFIVAFSGRGYRRGVWLALAPLAAGAVFSLGWRDVTRIGVGEQVVLSLFALLVGCMLCHGELHRLRPAPRYLSGFYLLLALGGAVGGLAVGIVAPRVFDSIKEFHFGAVLCAGAVLAALAVGKDAPLRGPRRSLGWSVAVLVLAVVAGGAGLVEARQGEQVLARSRGFYGTLAVRKIGESDAARTGASFPIHALYHGATRHGYQARHPQHGRIPTSYYSTKSGLAAALQFHPKRERGRVNATPFRAGVIGLGIGTIATYGRTGETYRFYEISDEVVKLAQGAGGYFDYLATSPAKIEVVRGDARLSLRQELEAAGQGQQFDVLVLDAFNGDALPLHLLTQEAFALYLAHLDPQGVLAIHASSRYFALEPVIARHMEALDLAGLRYMQTQVSDNDDPSEWLVLSRSRPVIAQIGQRAPSQAFSGEQRLVPVWTDDRSNVLQVVKVGGATPLLTIFAR
jgi:hypothetical protein